MDEYVLFLDESETANFNKQTCVRENTHFVIGGIICKKEYHDTVLTNKVNELKRNIWNRCDQDAFYKDKILHELELSRAITKKYKQLSCEYNKIFKNKHIYNFTYDMLADIIENSELFTLSATINEDGIHEFYNPQILNDRMQIAMNVLIENFFHFLNEVNGFGTICYESLPENQNQNILRRYKGIKYNGTMFYPAKLINKRIKGIEFRNKKENIIGLQLTDFIPNSVGRHYLGKTYNNLVQRSIPYSLIESKSYDGNSNNIPKFGMKIIP